MPSRSCRLKASRGRRPGSRGWWSSRRPSGAHAGRAAAGRRAAARAPRRTARRRRSRTSASKSVLSRCFIRVMGHGRRRVPPVRVRRIPYPCAVRVRPWWSAGGLSWPDPRAAGRGAGRTVRRCSSRARPGSARARCWRPPPTVASGSTVLRARGVESEAGLDHAALLEVLGPGARPARATCRRGLAAALAAAVGWRRRRGVAGNRYLVGAGTLDAAGPGGRTRSGAGARRRPPVGRPGVGTGPALRRPAAVGRRGRHAVRRAGGRRVAAAVDGIDRLASTVSPRPRREQLLAGSPAGSPTGCGGRPAATRWRCWRPPPG